MASIMKLALMLASILVLSGCGNSRYITASALNEKIQNNEPVLVLDMRTAYEFKKGHIPGAVNIPFWKTPFTNESKLDCEGKTIVIHCAHGPRAGLGKFFIEGKECPDIHYLKGHFPAWEKADLP